VQSVGRKYVLDFNDGGTTQVAGDGQDTWNVTQERVRYI
jgi:hypothetical protein